MNDTKGVCPRCGKPIRSGFKVCVECGEVIRPPSLAELSGQKREVRKIKLAGVLSAVLILAIAVAVLANLVSKERCTKPSVKIDGECCIDENSNRVCDKYERYETTTTIPQSTTTVTPETSTTSSTSTTTSSTTTTTVFIRCRINADCGQKNESLICLDGDVYVLRSSPKCMNPGKPDAFCVELHNKLEYPKERCRDMCRNGECVSSLSLRED